MPKMKSHRASSKRFRATGTGKLMRNQSMRSHLNSKKSSKRKTNLDSTVAVSEADMPRILTTQLPYIHHIR